MSSSLVNQNQNQNLDKGGLHELRAVTVDPVLLRRYRRKFGSNVSAIEELIECAGQAYEENQLEMEVTSVQFEGVNFQGALRGDPRTILNLAEVLLAEMENPGYDHLTVQTAASNGFNFDYSATNFGT